MEKWLEAIVALAFMETFMLPKIFLSQSCSLIDINIIKLLNFYNLKYKILKPDSNIESEACLLLNCDILSIKMLDSSFKDFLLRSFSNIFLYNLSPINSNCIELLTESKITLSSISDNFSYYNISDNDPEICNQLSGSKFQANEKNRDFYFKTSDSSIRTLININSKPYYIYFNIKNCRIFAVANNKMVNLDQKVTSEEFNTSNIFSEFAPFLMFLKYVLKDKFWHSPNDYACFIIDDPSLKKKYGFLDFKKLSSLMDQYNCSSNIAFIPYNYSRSDNEVVCMFNDRDDKLSISIHGCDHSESEFGISDEKELNRKIQLALSRMEKHKNITGIDHNKVMIFPQGSFSSNSIKVLKANNFLAAINSKVLANDISSIDISSFFSPANMNYFNFPIFLRRYPKDISDFALDLFMSKPIFLVEHHDYFKDDYKNLCKFITDINNKFPKIKWKSPQYIMKNFFLEKREQDSSICVKIFSGNTIIRNNSNKLIKYNIIKQEDELIPIEKIFIEGIKTDYVFKNKTINLKINIKPKEQIEIKILYHNFFDVSQNPNLITNCKILMRRLLTEIRDNYFTKNETLLRMASKNKSFIKKITG